MNKHLQPKAVEIRQLLALDRERSRIWRAMRDLPLVELAEPHVRGWERTFVLSERSKRRSDAEILATILTEINTIVRCWNRAFRPRRGRRRILHFENQGLSRIRAWRWQKLRWPEGWKKRYFNHIPHPILRMSRFEFARPDVFEFRIKPNLVTHVQAICPEMRQRVAEIEAYLEPRGGWRRIGYLKGESMREWLDPKSAQTLRADESYDQQLADLRSEGVIAKTPCPCGFGASAITFPISFGPQALKRCSGLLSRRVGSVTLGVYQFSIMGFKH